MTTDKTVKLDTHMRAFLHKVDAGVVRHARRYSARRGMHDKFYGGEKMIAKAISLGLVEFTHIPKIGHPAPARLTRAGRAILSGEKGN